MLQWLKNKAIGSYRYFRPETVSQDIMLEEGKNVELSSDYKEVVLEEQKTDLPVAVPINTASTYQIIAGFSRLIFSRENRVRIAAATTLTTTATGFNFLAPYLMGETIKLMSSDKETTTIAGVELSRSALISQLVLAYTLAQAIPKLRDQLLVQVTENNTLAMITQTTDHMLKKSLGYHVTTSFPDMIFLIQKGYSVGRLGTPILTQIAPTLFEIIVACSVLSNRYGSNMGIGIGTLLSVYTLYSGLASKPIINSRKISLDEANKAWSIFDSAIARYKTIHDFGKLKDTMDEVYSSMKKSVNANVNAFNMPIKFGYGHIVLSRLSMLLALLYVGSNIKSGQFTVEDLIILISYLNLLCALLPGFGDAINQLFASYPDVKFVFSELLKPDEIIDLHPTTPLVIEPDVAPTIEFDKVSFSYPPKKGKKARVLFEDLSFTIKAGEKVAFVSESGAGKTTIFNLLFGYYVPTKGVIRINGQDINSLSLKSLQSQIGLLGQTPNLFKGSVRDNILFGAPNPKEVTDAMIWDLARSANLEGFLKSLHAGKEIEVDEEGNNNNSDHDKAAENVLDMDVGENGKTLSGGQQQKVAILRGLLKQCSIRLLDEITAPFDSESATQIMRSLDDACEGKTCLMITHKLSEVRYVDSVIVIDKGKAIAKGTPDELLATCPLFHKLWTAYNTHQTDDSSTDRMLSQLGGAKSTAETPVDNASYAFTLLSTKPKALARVDDDNDSELSATNS